MTRPAPSPEHFPQDYPLPSIHLNGTGRESLIEAYQAALHTANQLHYQLRQPLHARDYYVQDNEAFNQASDALGYHMRALEQIRHYLERHLIHCREVIGPGRPAA